MTTTCPTCNGELLTSNGQTFCPACLLQQGMKSSTYGGGPRVAWKPPEIEQLTVAFPHLEIQQLLGVGGMGAVFKVRQKELDRIAALKVLPGEMAADAGFTERFLREARLLASLSHPHIVTVYEFGQRDGIYFLLMEFIDGVTLRQALRAEPIKKLGSKETLAIVGQLCDALQFAHDEGVVHRDIKPENILIDKRGRVKIADFGLARLLGQSPTMPTLTRTHQLMGTPAYMAPEQIEGLPGIDHRADIYSMGVVFYELLTGELPLGRFSPPSERAETDVRLDEVVLRTLAKEPNRRYQQASQVKVDVEALRSPAVIANPLAWPARRRWIGKGVIVFILGVLATPVIAILLYLSLVAYSTDPRHADLQEMVNATLGKSAATVSRSVPQIRIAAPELSRDRSMHVDSASGGYGETTESRGNSMFSDPNDLSLAINFENTVPLLNAQLFNLTDEQRAAVNAILKETHQSYLREEALHSIVSVDANGVQTAEISAFPDQLRAIENEMWTKLDDAVPVETQKEFRTRLNLYTVEEPSDDSGSMGMGGYGGSPGMGMAPSMGSAVGGALMGMPGGMMGGSPGRGPGLLGWEAEHYPLKIKLSRSGRWFEWSIGSKESVFVWEKAPTLPSALQRYYREPGPWMAVANARATYAAKNWMKLTDYFTAESMTREWVIAMADLERLDEKLQLKSADFQKRFNERLEAETLRITETQEMVRIGSGEDNVSSDFNNTHLRPLMLELAGVSATEVDGPIARVTQAIPLQTLKQHFGCTVLVRWLITEQGLDGPSDFAAMDGEVALYKESGDTASATLTIPNKLVGVRFRSHNEIDETASSVHTVPIRFKRENGQWKIDAIGSNERLLERLKETKIWKQHAEIEAVLENARTAYAAKEWQKLADCFSPTGRLWWWLNSQLASVKDFDSLSKDKEEAVYSQLEKLGSKFNFDPPTDQQRIDRLVQTQIRLSKAAASDVTRLCEEFASQLPEDEGRFHFLMTVVMRQALSQNSFEPMTMTLTDLDIQGNTATGNLTSVDDASIKHAVMFQREGDHWKIHRIGTAEELWKNMKAYQKAISCSSPETVIKAFETAIAEEIFSFVPLILTDDCQDEWLGEMIVALLSADDSNVQSRMSDSFSDREFHEKIRADFLTRLSLLSAEAQQHAFAGHSFDEVFSDKAVSNSNRRKAAIDLARLFSDREKLLLSLLELRGKVGPPIGCKGSLSDLRGEEPGSKYGVWTFAPQKDATTGSEVVPQPKTAGFLQIDGLWKLNTIIDPALKPWPLPVVEETIPQSKTEAGVPPADAVSVDGATVAP